MYAESSWMNEHHYLSSHERKRHYLWKHQKNQNSHLKILTFSVSVASFSKNWTTQYANWNQQTNKKDKKNNQKGTSTNRVPQTVWLFFLSRTNTCMMFQPKEMFNDRSCVTILIWFAETFILISLSLLKNE